MTKSQSTLHRAAMAILVVLVAAACGEQQRATPDSVQSTRSASVAGDSARGLALMNDFRDSLPAHSGNALRCTSCHLDGGLRASAMPWIGSDATYPRFRGRSASVESMAFRINDCIARSLAGKVLADTSKDMRDMLAYLASIGTAARPEGVDTITLVGHATSGERGYAANCARCHGQSGEGTGIAPAVWGADSYSIGAGMARQKMLATFLRHNMPFDQPGTLTAQEAADIAAFVLTQPRQDMPGKENDWPRGDPPRDAAYATNAARAAGKLLPSERPVLPRRVFPD